MTILFAGGEPQDFLSIGGWDNSGALYNNSIPVIDTNTAHFRQGFARMGLGCTSNNGNGAPVFYNLGTWNASEFWWSFRFFISNGYGNVNPNPLRPWVLLSSDGRQRLFININNGTWTLMKMDNAGTTTILTTGFSISPTINPSTPDKIDIYCKYAVAGRFTLYINGFVALDYSGDLTTNSLTALYGFQLSTFYGWSGTVYNVYSEIVVSTADTRQMSVASGGPDRLGTNTAWTNQAYSWNAANFGASGSNDSLAANVVYYQRFLSRCSGQVTTSKVQVNSGYSGNVSQMAIYSDNNNSPGTRLGLSNTVTSPSGAVTYTWTSGPVIDEGVYYWQCWACGSGNSGNQQRGNNAGGLNQTGTSSPPSSPAGSGYGYIPYMEIVVSNPYSYLLYNDIYSDLSGSAGQLQEYGVSPTNPAGSYGIIAVVLSARAAQGTAGPTKFDFVLRVGGAEYLSADQLPTGSWSSFQNTWMLNPATSVAWAFSDINDATFQVGYKSVA